MKSYSVTLRILQTGSGFWGFVGGNKTYINKTVYVFANDQYQAQVNAANQIGVNLKDGTASLVSVSEFNSCNMSVAGNTLVSNGYINQIPVRNVNNFRDGNIYGNGFYRTYTMGQVL